MTGAPRSSDVDAVVIGAGFAGLYLLHRLRGLGLATRVFEVGDDVGGTWYWNRYPGARCDVESVYYSYSFSPELEQEWEWSRRYPEQPEVLRYLCHVADRFDLRRDITFATRVTGAVFDESTNRWTVHSDGGATISARFIISAVGCLSTTNLPDFAGLDEYAGEWYHTGRWPHEGVDFTGKRVGLVGTGSTGIQAAPEIAKQASHLTVFQRTPNFTIPAHDAPLEADHVRRVKENYPAVREASRWSSGGMPMTPSQTPALQATEEERQNIYEAAWQAGGFHFLYGSFGDILREKEANDTAAEFIRGKIRDIVNDPETAEKLSPRNHPYGTKRPPIDTGYYATFNRDNVTLVDIRETPIARIIPNGILLADGSEYAVDAIVFATGFDAMTGTLLNIDIRGKNGLSLWEKWGDGVPHNYLGLQIAGFPNLFMITGPGSPSVLSNMVTSIEQHVDWVADCIADMRARGRDRIEATADAERVWVDHTQMVAQATLFPMGNSWYMGDNIPGKRRVFTPYAGGVGPYRRICDDVAEKDYQGFVFAA